jgi:hypothetical protein
LLTTSGCRSISVDEPTAGFERLRQIKIIALDTPSVTVLRRQLGDDGAGATVVGPSPMLPILPAPPPPTQVAATQAEADVVGRNVVEAVHAALRRHPEFAVTDDLTQADAVLRVKVRDHHTTPGRMVMGALGTVVMGWPLALVGMVVPPFRAGYEELVSPIGMTKLDLLLEDRASGNLLWRYQRESLGGFDLRNADSARDLFNDAVRELATRRGGR